MLSLLASAPNKNWYTKARLTILLENTRYIDGVIGALAAVGLLGSGSDGRYVQIGSIRSLEGLHPVETVLGTGITVVQTLDAKSITSGLILTDRLRPSRLNGKPILFVEWQEECWVPLKLD